MTPASSSPAKLRIVRLLAWLLVALAVAGIAALMVIRSRWDDVPHGSAAPSSFGGPFTLVDGSGKSFSSANLRGKPYAIYFGFTRCGDVCPTTLSRMVKLRNEAGGADKFNIVFVTIDPENDGPKEVGQYAGLFNSPIIGLTGTPAQIEQVKKQYGIYAHPSPHPMPGKEMEHSAVVLMFDGDGRFVTTISPDQPDADAIAKLKKLVA